MLNIRSFIHISFLVIFFSVKTLAQSVSGWYDNGCGIFTYSVDQNYPYEPTSPYTPAITTTLPNNSVEACQDLCIQFGAPVAAMSVTLCGCDFLSSFEGYDYLDCSAPCPGDPSETCGGPPQAVFGSSTLYDVYEVYSFTEPEAPTATIPPPPPPTFTPVEPNLPPNWVDLGCGTLNWTNTFAETDVAVTFDDNTAEKCISYCECLGYMKAAVDGTICSCTSIGVAAIVNAVTEDSYPLYDGYCMTQCPGNSEEACGGTVLGDNVYNIYYDSSLPPPVAPSDPSTITTCSPEGSSPTPTSIPLSYVVTVTTTTTTTSTTTAACTPTPSAVQSVDLWTLSGCYPDDPDDRTLSHTADVNGPMTVESCVAACQNSGYSFAGVENSDQCFCDNSINNNAQNTGNGCTSTCQGNSLEYCGGASQLNIYQYNPQTPPPPTETWADNGCYVDSVDARVLSYGPMPVNGPLTVEDCLAACQALGWPFAGVEYASQCFCDSQFENGPPSSSTGCNMPCTGNSSEFCGGGDAIEIYGYGSAVVPPTPYAAPPGWTDVGCYVDDIWRRVLPYYIPTYGDNSIEICTSACAAAGFEYAGVENTDECYCGSSLQATPDSDDEDCSYQCSGDPSEYCGGNSRIEVYSQNGQSPTPNPPPLSQWTPLGCYADSIDTRTLRHGPVQIDGDLTIEKCEAACSDYKFAGVEYADQCFCANEINPANGGTNGQDGCNTPCSGDPSGKEICGGGDRINIYLNNSRVNQKFKSRGHKARNWF